MEDADRNEMNMDSQNNGHNAEEISKKDLLQEMGISYGQFYRWKRMGLIPEAWFHRRSTFTGQETFLPRQKVMERIERIQEWKDRLSLDEIADMLSPDAARRSYTLAELSSMGLSDPRALELLPRLPGRDELRYLDMLALMLIQKLLMASLPDDHIRRAADAFLERFEELGQSDAEKFLVIAVRDAAAIIALHTGNCLFDPGTSVAASVNLNKLIENLNLRLRDLEEQ